MACKRKPRIHIAKRKIRPGYPTYVIAEIANNHQGSLEMASWLIIRIWRALTKLKPSIHMALPKVVLTILFTLFSTVGSGPDEALFSL